MSIATRGKGGLAIWAEFVDIGSAGSDRLYEVRDQAGGKASSRCAGGLCRNEARPVVVFGFL
jgi:hypothetical protein